MKLHCSQTRCCRSWIWLWFEIPMKLHCSQTPTIGKQLQNSLRSLWNYTALKRVCRAFDHISSLRSLWNYTALKRVCKRIFRNICLRSLWNYTALKHLHTIKHIWSVWDPYEITLLSNTIQSQQFESQAWDPYEITLLSNLLLGLQTMSICLRSLWNYTALKPVIVLAGYFLRLRSLWNYTALKQSNLRYPT